MTTPLIRQPIKLNEEPIKIHSFGEDHEIDLYVTSYQEPAGLAVVATIAGQTHEIFGKVSVSINESPLLPDWGFFVKEYAENEEWVPKLIETGLFTRLDIQARTGRVFVKSWQLTSETILLVKKILTERK